MKALVVGSILLASRLCLAQSSSATPTATRSLAACGRVSSILASYAAASPSATLPAFIDVQLAQECYDSVPLDQDDATNMIDGLSAMLEFQSDLEFLANPPPGYLLAGVDLQAELSDLRDQVTSGKITGEIDFETRVATILAKAHDGHLTYQLDGLSILQLNRLVDSFVSVSLDGSGTPKVYLYTDVVEYANGSGTDPVAVTSVNDVDVTEYILKLAQNTTFGGLQDPDALYNTFLWSWNDGADVQPNPGLFLGFSQEPFEAYTNITFENGTVAPVQNVVTTRQNFTGVVDGNSFYQAFLNASDVEDTSAATSSISATGTSMPTATGTATATSKSLTSATSIYGYPTPTVISEDGALSGYFLDAPGFEDTAVLALRFMTEAAAESFQSTLTKFLDACRSSNKQQLVIDVTGNPGGTTALAYDTLKQLFPSLDPYGAGNYRAHEGFQLLGRAISNVSAETTQEEPNNYTALTSVGGASVFNAFAYLNANNTKFSNFSDYYGPAIAPNEYGNYTNLSRYDLANVNYEEATSEIQISGYANASNLAPQPFKNSNIILLTDGACSSTCSILAHFLKYQAKVKSITLGGRPQSGPMQAVGGIKGSQVMLFQSLGSVIFFAYENFDSDTLASWSNTTLETLYNLGEYLAARTASAGQNPQELSFNMRNNIAEGDTSLTPLQYVYEAADCRLYYQPKHILDITTAWTDVASQAFGLNSTTVFSGCVDGSTNQPTSLSGDADLYANGTLQNSTDVVLGAGIANQTTGTEDGSKNAAGMLQVSGWLMGSLSLAAALVL